MQVTHAGYKDPNNLKFENIMILGVPIPPVSVSVTHVGNSGNPNSTTALPNININYDTAKQVKTHTFKCKTKLLSILFSTIYILHI